MKNARHQRQLGATSACTYRMAEDALDKGDTLLVDSWFTSWKAADAINNERSNNGAFGLECHLIGVLKTNHQRFPKKFLEETMKDWPAGTHLVLRSNFSNKNILAIGYKYKNTGVICFVATVGADLTTDGDPYRSKYLSENGNYKTRNVYRPHVCSNFYNAANKIDIHNQIRQGFLLLEEHWKTNDGFFRIITTIIGVTTTDSWLVSNFSFSSGNIYASLQAREFTNCLAYQLNQYPFPKDTSFAVSVPRQGFAPELWYERIVSSPDQFRNNTPEQVNTGTTALEEERKEVHKVGSTELKPGWSLASEVTIVTNVPEGAPEVSDDIKNAHQQCTIKFKKIKGDKQVTGNLWKICCCNSKICVKAKSPAYLCTKCGDFLCHDVVCTKGKEQSNPCCCFYSHMCQERIDGGLATSP